MPSPRDRNPYKGPWRVDLRLITELPEDDVVGRKFLINSITGSLLLLVALVTGWHFYLRTATADELQTWRDTINKNRAASNEVKNLRTLLFGEAAKVEFAHGILAMPMAPSRLITELGRARPEVVRLELIEGDDSAVLVRGSLVETSSTRASQLLGRFVDQLRRHPVIGQNFPSINLVGMARSERDAAVITFELSLRPKP
jgi:hypothetical protein